MTRDKFTQGKFVAPHGACFYQKGDILVSGMGGSWTDH
jgi:hypothetical protein